MLSGMAWSRSDVISWVHVSCTDHGQYSGLLRWAMTRRHLAQVTVEHFSSFAQSYGIELSKHAGALSVDIVALAALSRRVNLATANYPRWRSTGRCVRWAVLDPSDQRTGGKSWTASGF